MSKLKLYVVFVNSKAGFGNEFLPLSNVYSAPHFLGAGDATVNS